MPTLSDEDPLYYMPKKDDEEDTEAGAFAGKS